jgi:hypothetical protein
MHQDSAGYSEMKRRRLRARRVTMAIALVCAIVALALGAFQLHAEGLHEFLYRAPGVGASK